MHCATSDDVAASHPSLRGDAQTAVQAVNNGCGGAAIVDGRIDHAVLEELFSDEGAGTLVVADDEDEE